MFVVVSRSLFVIVFGMLLMLFTSLIWYFEVCPGGAKGRRLPVTARRGSFNFFWLALVPHDSETKPRERKEASLPRGDLHEIMYCCILMRCIFLHGPFPPVTPFVLTTCNTPHSNAFKDDFFAYKDGLFPGKDDWVAFKDNLITFTKRARLR